jgi:hypothetical protein
LVSEDSAVDMSFALIAGERARANEAERERFLKRAGAGVAVVLLHVLFLLVLLTAGHFAAIRHRAEPKEVFLLFPPPPHPHTRNQVAPLPIPTVIPKEIEAPPHTITAPQQKSQEHAPGDVMEAIGKELACGAGPYEHLSQAEREACKRQPWKFKKTPKGVIVLDTVDKPPAADPTSGADEELRMQQTADPCIAAGHSHSECIHKTLFGR